MTLFEMQKDHKTSGLRTLATGEIFEDRSLDPCFRRATIRLKEVTPGRRDYERLIPKMIYYSSNDLLWRDELGRSLH